MTEPLLNEVPARAKAREASRVFSPKAIQPFQGSVQLRILRLQRILGNREVTRLLQARRLSPSGEIIAQRAAGHDEPAAATAAERVNVPAFKPAHELTHAIQERDAGAVIQRSVREQVLTDFQPGAQACLVHLHGNEENSRQAARDLRSTHCVNFVDLSNTTREIHAGKCSFDPNRIFTASGLASNARVDCDKSATAREIKAAHADVQDFRDKQLNPQITACRGGTGADCKGPLPIAAFHNNTSFPRNQFDSVAETDKKRTGGGANPSFIPGANVSDSILVTDPADFNALKSKRNVVLQSTTPTDDGSLSILLAGDRYVNIEKEGKKFKNRTDPLFIENRAMGLDVLAQFGVGRQPCKAAAADVTFQRKVPDEKQTAAQKEPVGEESTETIWEQLKELWDSLINALENVGNRPDPLPREQAPANLPQACQTFNSQADLDTKKATFTATIAGMMPASVVEWIIGMGTPPFAADREARQQMECLIFALQAAAARPGSSIHLPAGSTTRSLIRSPRRSFAQQQTIWKEKFDFTRAKPFDRISNNARSICGSLLSPADTKWNPRNSSHQVCWGVGPGSSLPPGTRALTADERQQEILQASSAPGISRHHWGTDFDIVDPDMNPDLWQKGQTFADEYGWLIRNASTYGFIQSFNAASAIPGPGYIEERWHWSYYPVAQALLEFTRANRAMVQSRLTAAWVSDPRFSYIRRHWRDYMFHVNEHGVF